MDNIDFAYNIHFSVKGNLTWFEVMVIRQFEKTSPISIVYQQFRGKTSEREK